MLSFRLPPLPYSPSALSPFLSAETLKFHHGKHHRAYVDKTNEILEREGSRGDTLVEVIRAAKRCGNQILFQNSAQIWNHSFYWKCLAPPQGQRPTGRLAKQINDVFGSAQDFSEIMLATAVDHFSNGWVWLVIDRGELRIISMHDAYTPIVHLGLKPLLALDVWEHAYYIDYRNRRWKYADQVLGNLVNWDFVAANLDGRGDHRADQPRLGSQQKSEDPLVVA